MDSLSLTFPQAEKIFLQKNLQLLAQQYDVDMSKELVQQNRYWGFFNVQIQVDLKPQGDRKRKISGDPAD